MGNSERNSWSLGEKVLAVVTAAAGLLAADSIFCNHGNDSDPEEQRAALIAGVKEELIQAVAGAWVEKEGVTAQFPASAFTVGCGEGTDIGSARGGSCTQSAFACA